MGITGTTEVYCIIGHPISHSLSPVIHNAGFEAHGLDAVFVPFLIRPENIKKGFEGLRALGIKGCTVTVPFKEAVVEWIDEIDESVRLTGAVNTVMLSGKKSKGYNLDVSGVLYSFEKLGLKERSKAVVLGTGGAARAVLAALVSRHAGEIVILNRTVSRAEALRAFFEDKARATLIIADRLNNEAIENHLLQADILINTTPVGMWPGPHSSPVPESLIPKGIKILDAVYRPKSTLLLEMGRRNGCDTLSGVDWLVEQAIQAFRFWTSRELDRGLLLKLLDERSGGK